MMYNLHCVDQGNGGNMIHPYIAVSIHCTLLICRTFLEVKCLNLELSETKLKQGKVLYPSSKPKTKETGQN